MIPEDQKNERHSVVRVVRVVRRRHFKARALAQQIVLTEVPQLQ